MNTGRLPLFELIDNTVDLLIKNDSIYYNIATDITQKLDTVLYCFKDDLVDIHSRIKSPTSLKEKIIRNKLYKKYETPEEIIDNLSDLIGIKVECRFNKNEVELFNVIKDKFNTKAPNGLYYCPEISNLYFDLKSPQPQKQKNGQEIYRIDGKYIFEQTSVNFELQIKSLVNTFWSEIEHKIVYKNNAYIPNPNYIMEMLAAVRSNLLGIDKILQLVSDQIQNFSAHSANNSADINFVIAKLISDTFIAKMSESIGFTVDFKRICDLISGYILNKYKDLPVREAQAAFLELARRFNEIYTRDIHWEQELYLEGVYIGEDKFSQIFGDRLITYMNTDYDWHIFFLILFHIESDSNNLESFNNFMHSIRSVYSDKKLYKKLYDAFDEDAADKIYDEITEFMAYTLSASASLSIIDNIDNEEEIAQLIDETISYIIDNFSSYEEFIKNRKKVQMMMLEKWSID